MLEHQWSPEIDSENKAHVVLQDKLMAIALIENIDISQVIMRAVANYPFFYDMHHSPDTKLVLANRQTEALVSEIGAI